MLILLYSLLIIAGVWLSLSATDFILYILYSKRNRKSKKRHDENADKCVYCGCIVPEGRNICPNCEKKLDKFNHISN